MLNPTNERNSQRIERRKPDPSTLQAWEALDATEAELCAARAKLAGANEALEAAREREDRLLKMIEERQIRLPHLVLIVAATAVHKKLAGQVAERAGRVTMAPAREADPIGPRRAAAPPGGVTAAAPGVGQGSVPGT